MTPTDRFRARKQPRQQRAVETRQAILEAAARVFAEYGYAAGTTNRIAEAADLSIGSLYQYFPNKDSILSALTDAHVDAGAALLRDRTAAGLPESLEELLRLFVRTAIDNHRDDTRLHRVLFEEAPRSPVLLDRLHRAEEGAVGAAKALLDSHSDVTVADTAFAARMVVATVESLTHRLLACDKPADTEQLEDGIVTMLAGYLRGLSTHPPARADTESHQNP
ncbi:TetR/AcrR family transcriptional regulator [Mycobacterium sp. DBP42]|uniref:TetR/AcrR family transcriptional regulator n=1 Tax=Mycobacterium sp. DBP42 TaxID=2545267 RepID=UPI00110CAE77|nr:TetR/AcrR family transcriptional regulator [Mycobacterium sp. DBP42]TMS55983.1 TetR/AcrR family transcriptional regulator [Mycobacterium sp. DBP42]